MRTEARGGPLSARKAREAKTILGQVRRLIARIDQDLQFGHFESDDARMMTFNSLLAQARVLYPRDMVLHQQSALPDSTLKAFSPQYLILHPDVASERTRECSVTLADRLEVLAADYSEANVLVRLLDRVKELSQSDLVHEKLRGLNIVVFIVVMTIVITHFIVLNDKVLSLSLVIIVPLSVVLSLVLAIGYEWLSEVLVNMITAKVFWLRASTVVLMTGIPVSVGALAFDKPLLAGSALGIIGLSILTIFLGSFLDAPSWGTRDSAQSQGKIKDMLGTIGNILGIADFVMSVVLLFIGHR